MEPSIDIKKAQLQGQLDVLKHIEGLATPEILLPINRKVQAAALGVIESQATFITQQQAQIDSQRRENERQQAEIAALQAQIRAQSVHDALPKKNQLELDNDEKEPEIGISEKELQLKQIFINEGNPSKAAQAGLNLLKFRQQHPKTATPFAPQNQQEIKFYQQLKTFYETAQTYLTLEEAYQISENDDDDDNDVWDSYPDAYKNIGRALQALVEENAALTSLLPPSFESFISAQQKHKENKFNEILQEYSSSIESRDADSRDEIHYLKQIAIIKYTALKDFLDRNPDSGVLPPPPPDGCDDC